MKSDQIKKGPERAPARSMLRATGLGDREIQQPMIAVVNTWSDVTPCNIHLRELGEHLKAGIREAGGTPFEFGGIVVTDGIRVKLDRGVDALTAAKDVVGQTAVPLLGATVVAVTAFASIGTSETGLPEARLQGERGRRRRAPARLGEARDVGDSRGAETSLGEHLDGRIDDSDVGTEKGSGKAGKQLRTINTKQGNL